MTDWRDDDSREDDSTVEGGKGDDRVAGRWYIRKGGGEMTE